MRTSPACVTIWCRYQRLVSVVRRVTDPLTDDRGDLSAYLAQGVLALASTTSPYGCPQSLTRSRKPRHSATVGKHHPFHTPAAREE